MKFDEALTLALKGTPCYRTTEVKFADGTRQRERIQMTFEQFSTQKVMYIRQCLKGWEMRLSEEDVLADDWEVI